MPLVWKGLASGRYATSLLGLATLVVSFFSYRAGALLLRAARNSRVWQDVADTEGADLVLYLRAFDDDRFGQAVPTGTLGLLGINPLQLLTEDEEIAEALGRYGQVIAVARPAATDSWLGARLVRLTDTEWQPAVTRYMSRARLIVAKTSLSPGLRWELSTVVREVDPRRLVLLVDDGDTEYRSFCILVRRIFPVELPLLTDSRAGRGRVRGVVTFSADWTPSYQPFSTIQLSLIRGFWTTPIRSRLTLALRSSAEQLGLPWAPPAVELATPLLGAIVLLAFTSAFWPALTQKSVAQQDADEIGSALRTAMSIDALPAQLSPPLGAFAMRVISDDRIDKRRLLVTNWEAITLGLQQARAGLSGLDDRDLELWGRAVDSLFPDVTERGCGDLFRGTISPLDLGLLLSDKNPSDQQRWFEALFDAAVVQGASGAAPRVVSPEEREALRIAFEKATGHGLRIEGHENKTCLPILSDLREVLALAERERLAGLRVVVGALSRL